MEALGHDDVAPVNRIKRRQPPPPPVETTGIQLTSTHGRAETVRRGVRVPVPLVSRGPNFGKDEFDFLLDEEDGNMFSDTSLEQPDDDSPPHSDNEDIVESASLVTNRLVEKSHHLAKVAPVEDITASGYVRSNAEIVGIAKAKVVSRQKRRIAMQKLIKAEKKEKDRSRREQRDKKHTYSEPSPAKICMSQRKWKTLQAKKLEKKQKNYGS